MAHSALSTQHSAKHGFTLVELSIVIVIIGLLIGGILVGQSLIESAKANNVISELRQYDISVNLFKERFGYLPGDFPRASAIFGVGATYAGNDTNGDGNGFINTGASGHEFMRVFEHMSKAGIVKKQYAAHDHWQCYNIVCQPMSSISDVKDSRLSSRNETEGYGLNYYSPNPWVGPWGGPPNTANPGHYWEFRRSGYSSDLEKGTVTPLMAMTIDCKIDDCLPSDGSVRGQNPQHYVGIGGSFQPCMKNGVAQSYYIVDLKKDGCVLFIKADLY